MLPSRRRHGAIVVCLLVTAFAVSSSPAMAAEGDPYLDECFSSGVTAPCTQLAPASNATEIEISPDGKHAYSFGVGAPVRLFSRGANNKLSPAGCYNVGGAGGCTALPSLGNSGGWDIDFSPDGASLYVTEVSKGLAHLRRDTSSGVLTDAGCYGPGAGCTAIAPVSGVFTVVVSNDGQSLYTRGGNTFGVFQRDQGTGALIAEPDGEDCFSEGAVAGCTDTYGLSGNAFEMDFSPDGKHLYYPIQTPGGIGFFLRSSNGTLSQISGPQGGCITTDGSSTAAGECATIPAGGGAMANAWAATVSPSGKHAFISGQNGTVAFSRDADSGKLTATDCLAPGVIAGCTQRNASSGMGVEVSPNGTRALVGAHDNGGGVGVYSFSESAGTLTPLPSPFGCFLGTPPAGCGTFPTSGSGVYGKARWTPDGLNFYAAANGPIANFLLDYAPTCQPATVAVPYNTSAVAPLACSDVNGQAITYEIAQNPTAGSLAAIDQGARTVRYNPFSGFTGADSFTYRGVAFGAASAPATATLNVAGPPPPPDDGDPGPTDADQDGVLPPLDCNDSNAAIRPGAVDVPGNGIDEDCSGADAVSELGIDGPGKAPAALVNAKGVFTLKGILVNCAGAGPDCAVKTKVTGTVAGGSAAKTVKLGGSSFVVKAGKSGKVKPKLTKKGLKLLKRLRKIRAKVAITVTRGAKTSKKTVKVTLKAPKRKR